MRRFDSYYGVEMWVSDYKTEFGYDWQVTRGDDTKIYGSCEDMNEAVKIAEDYYSQFIEEVLLDDIVD